MRVESGNAKRVRTTRSVLNNQEARVQKKRSRWRTLSPQHIGNAIKQQVVLATHLHKAATPHRPCTACRRVTPILSVSVRPHDDGAAVSALQSVRPDLCTAVNGQVLSVGHAGIAPLQSATKLDGSAAGTTACVDVCGRFQLNGSPGHPHRAAASSACGHSRGIDAPGQSH